jgi:DNA-directed RNA polymerase specialized sigma24 family protein
MDSIPGRGPFWWDREFDAGGKAIRADVRAAARTIWPNACERTRALLGEACEATGLMELSVVRISRYLDRRGAPPFSEDVDGLLTCAFCRALRRYARKLRRIELAGDIAELERRYPPQASMPREDCRLDAEKAVCRLSNRGRRMYEMRKEGFAWKEIAPIFNTTADAARAEFYRELKRARPDTDCDDGTA